MDAVHFSSKSDDWETPQSLFDELNALFGPFDVDVCAASENAKCLLYVTKNCDGLSIPWFKTYSAIWPKPKLWMNPPYGRQIGKWVKKAYEESLQGALVVCLLPSRTDTRWFHDYCLQPYAKISFIKGRLKFGGAKNSAPFPSMIVVFGG